MKERTLDVVGAGPAGLAAAITAARAGAGNLRLPATAVRGNLLLAGEAAGHQDPLWGFGMRYAMLSGHLAAHAWLAESPALYKQLWRERLAGRMKTATVNRFFYARFGDRGYRLLLAALTASGDPRRSLRRRHAGSAWKTLLFPRERDAVLRPASGDLECAEPSCDCTWCRCRRHRPPAQEVTPARCPPAAGAPAVRAARAAGGGA